MFEILSKKQYLQTFIALNLMGKGDRRSKRGKIWSGTTGKTRPKKGKKKKAALAAA